MLSLCRIAALSAALVAFTSTPPDKQTRVPLLPASAQFDMYARSYDEELFHAVLEGLYHDGVSNAVVDALLVNDAQSGYPVNFVWACPVCMPALNALRVYRARPLFTGEKLPRDTFGKGLAPELERQLTSPDDYERQIALRALIEGWIERRMQMLRLDEHERAEWTAELRRRRDIGTKYLAGYRGSGMSASCAMMKECPSCEGAAGACRVR